MTALPAALRVVAITDRRRMVPASATTPAAIADAFAAAIARALRGAGVDPASGEVVVQVREKDADGALALALARAAHAVTPWVVINDRADVARAIGAAGVHLPERGLAIADARGLVGDRALVGVSRHTGSSAPIAGADLVQWGPVFATPGKGDGAGVDALAAICRTHAAPIVAVGGIDDAARARAARAAGARAIAAIRAIWTGSLGALLE